MSVVELAEAAGARIHVGAQAHPEFQTDVESALYLCKSAIQAAITCIQPNLSRIKNEETRQELSAKVWSLQ